MDDDGRGAGIAAAFAAQARACRAMGSPFTAALLEDAPRWLDPATAVGARVLGWRGDPVADALALRLAGAFNALALSGRDSAIAAAWPPEAEGDPVAAARGAVARHDARLAAWLDGPPQTNEIGRGAVLLGGALAAVAETGAAGVELLEVGASAGLNLGVDGYAFDLGEGRRWGPAGAAVVIPSDWRGGVPPLDSPLRVTARAGCDLAPLDPGAAADRARLMAYIWPDQTARVARIRAALDDAAAQHWRVERAAAGPWLTQRLAQPQAEGLRLIWHSIFWQYLDAAQQAELRRAIEAAGARATAARPLGWLRMERDATPRSAGVALTLWPGGAERALGRTDFHGRWTEWTP